MDFKEVSEEEIGAMQFTSGRARNGKDPYGDLLQAVKSGRKVLVNLEEGKALKNLKWGLSQAAKKAEIKIEMKVLADKSGIVVSCSDAAQPPQAEAGETDTQAPTSGSRSRK
jgi:hypothetical protein